MKRSRRRREIENSLNIRPDSISSRYHKPPQLSTIPLWNTHQYTHQTSDRGKLFCIHLLVRKLIMHTHSPSSGVKSQVADIFQCCCQPVSKRAERTEEITLNSARQRFQNARSPYCSPRASSSIALQNHWCCLRPGLPPLLGQGSFWCDFTFDILARPPHFLRCGVLYSKCRLHPLPRRSQKAKWPVT